MQLTTNRYSSLPILLLLFSLVLTSCLDSSDSGRSTGNLLEEAEAIDDFSTFVDYLKQIDEAEIDTSTLTQEETPLTVLIPTNEAFSELPDGTIESLTDEELSEVLSYHIVEELIDLNNIDETADFESMQGEDLFFEIVPNNQGSASAFINGSDYLGGRTATNGYIYATGQVLFPDSYLDVTGLIAKRYQLNDLQDAIEDVAGLEEDLQNSDAEFTVFAPSDEALDGTSPTGNEIQYYVLEEKLTSAELSSQTYTTMSGDELDVDVSGATITVNGEATVTTADIEGTNGVVHIIDAALEAPSE